MIWKIMWWMRHLLLIGALYMFIMSWFELDWWWPDSRSQLLGGLGLAWVMIWQYMGQVASLTDRLAKRDQTIDDQREMIADLRRGQR